MKTLRNLAEVKLFNSQNSNLNNLIKFDPEVRYSSQTDRAIIIEGEKYFIESLVNVDAILGYVKLQKGLHLVVSTLVADKPVVKFILIKNKVISHQSKTFGDFGKNIYNLIVEYADLKPALDLMFGGKYNAMAAG
ncbi:hypothetical protein [Pedobacter sp.]|uniref:hypothetical protein n=1 Tax=Pedobacter sp. TaxID=1411316 RepID=UPI003D7FD3B1